ncbi:MAG: sigma-70 family RNA polymerase sigma factor [Bacteroidetes bacterium]|nr:sigma-70 family RNA polymerase sigma factor [Bacteroidota bacterium]
MARKKREATSLATSGISIAESKAIDLYLKEISKLPLITADEEVTLARQIQAGNKAALDKLITANLRFVVSVAKQYQNQGLSLIDLINEGNVGLIKAAHRFDETRGFKFISYAVWWIKQSIRQALDEKAKTVRLPLNKAADIMKLSKARFKLNQIHKREPSASELADETTFTETYISDLMRYASSDVSFDSPFASGEDSTLLDVMPNSDTPNPDKELMDESLKMEIERAFSKLTQREAEVVRLYFGIGREHSLTLEEIGERFDLTRERVRQIKEKALRKLRHNSRNSVLLTYI